MGASQQENKLGNAEISFFAISLVKHVNLKHWIYNVASLRQYHNVLESRVKRGPRDEQLHFSRSSVLVFLCNSFLPPVQEEINKFTHVISFIHSLNNCISHLPLCQTHYQVLMISAKQDWTWLLHSWSLYSSGKRCTLIKNHKNKGKNTNVMTSKGEKCFELCKHLKGGFKPLHHGYYILCKG